MKKLIIGTSLALALAATPAFAATYHSRMSARPVPGSNAYAAARTSFVTDGAPDAAGNPVGVYGKYQGNDPDPFIRQQLLRDPPNLDRQ